MNTEPKLVLSASLTDADWRAMFAEDPYLAARENSGGIARVDVLGQLRQAYEVVKGPLDDRKGIDKGSNNQTH